MTTCFLLFQYIVSSVFNNVLKYILNIAYLNMNIYIFLGGGKVGRLDVGRPTDSSCSLDTSSTVFTFNFFYRNVMMRIGFVWFMTHFSNKRSTFCSPEFSG